MGYKGQKKTEYQREWCAKRRAEYIAGMRCLFCDSDQDIHLHHRDPEKKVSHSIWSWSDERIAAELKKCVPLCGKCHQILHGLIRSLPLIHGTRQGYYQYKCRCNLCRAFKSYCNNTDLQKEPFHTVYHILNEKFGVSGKFVYRLMNQKNEAWLETTDRPTVKPRINRNRGNWVIRYRIKILGEPKDKWIASLHGQKFSTRQMAIDAVHQMWPEMNYSYN